MKCKMFGIFNILLGFFIFKANLQCMDSRCSGYSYIQDIMSREENFSTSVTPCMSDILPKFPSSLIISGVTFGYKGQFGSVFNGDDSVIVSKMQHGLYIFRASEDTCIRVLISIKLILDTSEAYYILNVDRYRKGRILNAVVILQEKLNLDKEFVKFVLPVEEITERLEKIVSGFTMMSS